MSTAEEHSAQPTAPYTDDDIASMMASRATVEQAKGILMECFSISADAAFAVLRSHSQHTNRKLVQIGAELGETGRLPIDPRWTTTDRPRSRLVYAARVATRREELQNRLQILLEIGRQLPFEEIDRLNLSAIDDPDAFKDEVLLLVASKRVRLSRRVVHRLRRQRSSGKRSN